MVILALPATAFAHFGMVIPTDDIISKEDAKVISLDLKFIHPFEGHYMQMDRPGAFGVMVGGKKTDLLGGLKPVKVDGHDTWTADYRIKQPGYHTFYVEPAPYWEPAEDCFIVHYTKVVVSAFGMEEGWDDPVGLKTEIIPLTRPYGLWTCNVFTGRVLLGGKPVPGAEVEVEYYNKDGKTVSPADPYVCQVVKADGNGVFTYAMPKAGWWGFAALSTDTRKLKGPDGEMKPVEIGAVMWVRTRDMK
jgi:cobalt/nickel transport protein